MNAKIIAFFTLLAIFVGCVVSKTEDTTSIQLHFNDGSSIWWIAVQPRDEIYTSVQIDLKDAGADDWVSMSYNDGWGYFSLSSPSGRGYALPLSLRLTADNGAQVIATVKRISANTLVSTKVQYDQVDESEVPTPPVATEAPDQTPPSTQAPVQSTPSTQAPTFRPPTAPTTRPPTAPTTRPPAASTTRPTTVPTQPPVTPTQAPVTQAPVPPTQAPVPPTQASTPKPTQAPTPKPTQAPTPNPTQAATPKPASPTGDACAIVPVSSEPLQILVPLYVYPGAAWDSLIAAAKTGVKIIAIINPNSGPSATGPDSSYVSYMKKFQDAGIDMVGYVHTSWGARDINIVNSEIGIWASKYTGVKGIFFDEGSTEAAQLSYYTTAYNTVLSKGFIHSILNPGLQPDQGYLDISTNIVMYENYASSLSTTTYSNWVKCAPSSAAKSGYQYKFSAIIHTASLNDMPALISQTRGLGIGVVYVTDGLGGCCTYNTLTSYFTAEASAVKVINSQ